MHTREFGESGLRVSAVGLGCMTMSGGCGGVPDRDETISVIRGAVESHWVPWRHGPRLRGGLDAHEVRGGDGWPEVLVSPAVP